MLQRHRKVNQAMASVFTRIIAGEIPGRFVWQDDRAVAFLTAEPLRPGHTLVVPRDEIDHWLDVPEDLAAHLMNVAQRIGRAQQQVFGSKRVGMMLQGFEVPHCHLHVWPANSAEDFDLAKADKQPDPAVQDRVAEKLRAGLRDLGYAEFV